MTDDIEIIEPPSRASRYAVVALIIFVGAFAVGVVGQLSGVGWFGYRSTLYGSGELYALNMGDSPLYVSVDGRERAEVPAENAEIAELIGGTSHVEVTDEAGKVVGRYDITAKNSHALLKLTDEGCLAATNVTPFYGGKAPEQLEFLDRIGPKRRVWVAESVNVIWPRKTFPKRLSGGKGKGIWVELVACELLDDPKFLDAYLTFRLDERMKKALGPPKK
jgi:hypothetical protein